MCYFYPRPLQDLSGHVFFPCRDTPKMSTFIISLLFKIGKNDGEIEIIGVCVKCTSFPSLPLLRL
jgi:hypothetical protein